MRMSIRSVTGFLAFILSAAVIGEAQTLDQRRELILTRDMDLVELKPTRAITFAGVTVPPSIQKVRLIRVRLRIVNPGTAPWTVIVEDSTGREVERVDATGFVDNEYWTGEIPGGSARVRLTPDGSGAQVEADKFATPITDARPQAIVGIDDSKDITHELVPPRVKLWAPAIGRLKFIASGFGGVCTGFLVGPDLLITNQHCISNGSEAASARVEFGVDSTASSPETFRVSAIEAVDARLDYSLLRLSGDAAAKFGRLFVGPEVSSAMDVVVIQHPQGNPKKAAFPPNCSVGLTSVAGVDDVLNDFGHVCDTLGGSSGSPVVEFTNGSIVGLHHWRWPDGAQFPQNQAVHIALIVKDLTDRAEKEQDPEKQKKLKAAVAEVTRSRPTP
jgi:hypothetical protein